MYLILICNFCMDLAIYCIDEIYVVDLKMMYTFESSESALLFQCGKMGQHSRFLVRCRCNRWCIN